MIDRYRATNKHHYAKHVLSLHTEHFLKPKLRVVNDTLEPIWFFKKRTCLRNTIVLSLLSSFCCVFLLKEHRRSTSPPHNRWRGGRFCFLCPGLSRAGLAWGAWRLLTCYLGCFKGLKCGHLILFWCFKSVAAKLLEKLPKLPTPKRPLAKPRYFKTSTGFGV